MKVFAIANTTLSRFINPTKNEQSNNYYFASRRSLDAGYDRFERTAFTGKPFMNINPSRKVFDRLPQEELTCACCGRKMIPPAEIKELEALGALRCKAPEAVKIISKYEHKLHTVEKDIFEILKKEAQQHPDWDFHQILENLKPEPEKHLIMMQLGIFRLIEKLSQNQSSEIKSQISNLITEETQKIMSGDNEFRRKRFVTKFEKIFENKKNSAVKEHLIRIATKLPTSYEDKNAFIVKYANRSAEEIGLRLLTYSMRTIEHITPQNCDGENHIFNYILECMRCNSFRQDRPMTQQLEEYPEMFYNAQHQVDNFVNWSNEGLLNKWYPIKIQQKLYGESEGTLKVNISKLKLRRDMYDEYSKLNRLETSEDKLTAKLTKKELKREKIKAQHIQKVKKKQNKKIK